MITEENVEDFKGKVDYTVYYGDTNQNFFDLVRCNLRDLDFQENYYFSKENVKKRFVA